MQETRPGSGSRPSRSDPYAIRIVTAVPGLPWGMRLRRSIALVAGYLLVLVGVLLGIPALALLVFVPFATITGDGSVEAWLYLGGAGAASGLPLWLGLRLARGRRRLVLFLRRFGFNDATETLTYAVTGALGRRWRLVTLDDTKVEAVGVHRASRVVWRLGRWAFLVVLAVGAWYTADWWFSGGPDAFMSGIVDPVVERAIEDAENPLEAIFAAIFVTLVIAMVAAVVLAFLIALIVLGLAAAGVATIAFWMGDRAVRRAEGSKALAVHDAADTRPVVDQIRGRARQIQAPRLTVVKVDDHVWRDVVRTLAEEAAVALVDVSEPSEHLAWEVALLKGDARARMVPIGRRDRVEALARGEGNDGAGGALRELLAGEEVLVYESGSDARALKRFACSLSAALDAPVRR